MKLASEIGIKKSTIVAPEGGWKPRTYYVIDVCYHAGNPIHRAIMYSSFLEEGNLTRRAEIFNGTYEGLNRVTDAYYVKGISEITGMENEDE